MLSILLSKLYSNPPTSLYPSCHHQLIQMLIIILHFVFPLLISSPPDHFPYSCQGDHPKIKMIEVLLLYLKHLNHHFQDTTQSSSLASQGPSWSACPSSPPLTTTLMLQLITECLSILLKCHMILLSSFQVFEDATLSAQTIPHSLQSPSPQHLLAPPFSLGLRWDVTASWKPRLTSLHQSWLCCHC